MSYKKYLKDYSVEAQLDAKGRLKASAVYTGGDYTLSPVVSVNDKRKILAASILAWLALIGALVPVTKASQVMYVIIPFAFSAMPMFLTTWAAAALLREGGSMTRKKAEKISKRLPTNSLLTTMLSGASFLGFMVFAILNWAEMLTADIFFGILSLITTLAAAFIYSRTRGIKAQLRHQAVNK